MKEFYIGGALLAGVAAMTIVGGTRLSRRLRWPPLLSALLFLGLSTGAFVFAVLLAYFYFQLNDDQAVPWIEKLGIGLALFVAASGITSLYFFGAASWVPHHRILRSGRHRR